ncbi:MAG: ABC-F family ATP-binding cassette domain-containing protein [Acidobacteria bacterium]|nr:ABC-F family ATP-binding cassette domain-containing protein [Acidobacteriota bacterium]
MPDNTIIFQNVTFLYDGAAEPLFRDLSLQFSRGWTGIVGANGVGKSTILKLSSGLLEPREGRVIIPEFTLYCEQRTDEIPALLTDLLGAADSESYRIRDRLGVEDDWLERWETLSHGERKRAQIAAALWWKPEVLALDEPTNHLDAQAQEMLFSALQGFNGTGLLVSHDRELLDDLCSQCLFIEPPDAIIRPGNYSASLEQTEQDNLSAQRSYANAKQDYNRIKHEASRRRSEASQADRKRSKKGIARNDHDAKAKIDAARLTGKDGDAGKRLSQMEGRLSQAREKMSGIEVKKTYTMGIWMPGEKSKRDTLFSLPDGILSLGEKRELHYPDLLMKPDDRIALTGVNGSGKSTLIKHIMESLNLPDDKVVYIPQEIDLGSSQDILNWAKGLPPERLGRMMTVVSRLGSRPHRLLESTEPSPGEIRKVLLAVGIANMPHLIVMDEPTNHLDLPSIESLEDALTDCPCGLLLVSHDRRFLEALTEKRWSISEEGMTSKYILETD